MQSNQTNNKLLVRQKLNKKKRRNFRKNLFYKSAILSVILLILTSLGHFGFSNRSYLIAKLQSFSLDFSNSNPWIVDVTKMNPSATLTAEQIQNIGKLTEEMLYKKFSNTEIAQEIQAKFNFSKVNLLSPLPNHLTVSIDQFIPSVIIEADTWRYLTEDGTVFGVVDIAEKDKFTQLSGLLPNTSSYIFNPNSSLALNTTSSLLIQEALLLQSTALKTNHHFSSIAYFPYRGFFAKLSNSQIEIAFGLSPFEKKFKRLDQILESLHLKGLKAERIELDYEGKAFIKEKSI